MKILIIEDKPEKRADIRRQVEEQFRNRSIEVSIEEGNSLQSAVKWLDSTSFDIIIFDLLLPQRNGDTEAYDSSSEIAELLRDNDLNRAACTIAITEYGEVREECLEAFQLLNIHVLKYEAHSTDWKISLQSFLDTALNKPKFDFIIIAALEKEAAAFNNVEDFNTITRETAHGIVLKRCSYMHLNGAIVKLPNMGPVTAAAIVTQCLSKFRCDLYAMSGICAGIPKNAHLGDLVLAESAFDYQAGKIDRDGNHKVSQFPAKVPGQIIHRLRGLLETTDIDETLRADVMLQKEFKTGSTKIGAVASGSAVINDEEFRNAIEAQGRDICGIDMEVFAFYRAIELSGQNCRYFAVKSVVDLADGEKNDTLQLQGCILSARLTVSMIAKLT